MSEYCAENGRSAVLFCFRQSSLIAFSIKRSAEVIGEEEHMKEPIPSGTLARQVLPDSNDSIDRQRIFIWYGHPKQDLGTYKQGLIH